MRLAAGGSRAMRQCHLGGVMVRARIVSPFPKHFTDRQWARYIKLGRELVEGESQLQFELGDITLKMVPKVEDGRRDHGVFSILDRYADQIGINVHTLINYRQTAMAWPKEHREAAVSFSVHQALSALEDRFELIQHPPTNMERWTEDAALRRAGRLPHRPLTKEEKLDRIRTLAKEDESATGAVEELIRRPDVAQKIMASPSNQRILYRAHHEQRQQAAAARFAAAHERHQGEWEEVEEEAEEVRQTRRREPAVDYQRASREVLELIGSGTTFLVDLQRMIPNLHVTEFTEREVRAVLDNHRRIRAALDWCDSALSTGDKSMDEELARILSEGDDAE
ncbi:DUF6192 family protein [Streptomyces sp. NPDC059122]|uniref:DUF6192 family protein n=1 Tax=Streptomyces sp. NPDC059122 TaxID=3346732 RepID=UPI0036C63012